eukprot:CAMPEP_0180430668 /NCGR_PEP_ID=MMETSP1036_2-20121128/8005_1 /TAXON_ID=632150 /ORGANISM="Azadinium spinosum, Strain 3D9" /LENGTH=203 /DNA_ID=CAMNT_0022436411 /DNA_START=32 /DNA_END=643 /DNA_ORIENTATION=-
MTSSASGLVKQRVLELFRELENRVRNLEAENTCLLAQNLAFREHMGDEASLAVLKGAGLESTDHVFLQGVGDAISEQSSNIKNTGEETSEEKSVPGRKTIMSHGTLGTAADDSAEVVKRKYRAKLLQEHPDKGGSHEQFLEVQASIEYIASKRQSVAVLLSKTFVGDSPGPRVQDAAAEITYQAPGELTTSRRKPANDPPRSF